MYASLLSFFQKVLIIPSAEACGYLGKGDTCLSVSPTYCVPVHSPDEKPPRNFVHGALGGDQPEGNKCAEVRGAPSRITPLERLRACFDPEA